MKQPIANAPPRRLATPRKQTRLDLRRRPAPEPDDEKETGRKSSFWKWVGLVALLHLLLFGAVYWYYASSPAPVPPPEQFMSLLPSGDVVKGTPGAQQAPKLGPTTPAPSVHHVQPPPEPETPTAVQTPSEVKPPPVNPDKSFALKPAPAKPKVKVDLHLVDGPASAKHVPKPKPHIKKPVVTPPADDASAPDKDTASNPDSAGLSKEEIAAQLGAKLKAAGAENAEKTGVSGSDNSHANSFQDFYDSIRDQVMSKWTSPNLTDETAVNPVVQIHVEKDGRVPPESVQLIRSSGNQSYDDSAVAAAKSLGYLYQPLPDGCPPDIPITFKLTR